MRWFLCKIDDLVENGNPTKTTFPSIIQRLRGYCDKSVKSSIIPCDLLLMSNFLIMGVLSRFCFPLSWFFYWFARSGPTLPCMVVWKNYTIPRSVALKSAKYKARIAENSFILDAVSRALRELLSNSFEFLFLTVLCQSDDSLKDGAE